MSLPLLVLTTIVALTALGLSVASRRALRALAERLAAIEARPVASSPSPATGTIRRVDRVSAMPLSRPTLITVPDLAAKGVRPSAPLDLDQRFASIWALADLGFPAEAIARETGQPIGQVELILGLKRPRTSAGGAPLP